MKKIIFSAIAVVAFVGSSMASNKVEKNVFVLDTENDCLNVYSAVSIYAKKQGASEKEADRIARIARQACWDAMGSQDSQKVITNKVSEGLNQN